MAKTKYLGFTSYEQTRPHLMFHPHDLDLLNTAAALERRTLSRQIEVIVTAWLTEYKALHKGDRDVFHNSKGQALVFPEAER